MTVHVHGRDFKLPAALLCYNSTCFHQKLNGDGGDARIKLEDGAFLVPHGSPETFELVVQWMYTSNIVLPVHDQPGSQSEVAQGATPKPQNAQPKTNTKAVDLTSEGLSPNEVKDVPMSAASRAITSYLEFFKMADQIGLLGPFEILNSRVKAFLLAREHNLLPCHVRSAVELPRGHAMRKLFAQACVAPYMRDITVCGSAEFRFSAELNEIDAFVVDLFHEFNKTVRLGVTETAHWPAIFQFIDPLTGTPQRLHCKRTIA